MGVCFFNTPPNLHPFYAHDQVDFLRSAERGAKRCRFAVKYFMILNGT